jgi:alpha-tubulin suppressor-like RCC1 family protein
LPIKFRVEDGALITGLWATVGLGINFGCGITTEGEGYCWGQQINGQGGTGKSNFLNKFIQPIVDGTRTLATIDGGSWAHCALATDGTGWCSGYNSWEILGTSTILPLDCGGGNVECVYEPVMVDGGPFTELHLRDAVGCGLTGSGAAYCWGGYQAQFLGTGSDGTLEPCDFGPANCSRTPAAVRGNHVFTTMTDGAVMCGLTASGDPLGNVWCWGENKWGPVGNGTNDNRYYEPVRGGGGMTFAEIDGGANNTCALTDAGAVWCWGRATDGVLGIGNPTGATLCFVPSSTYCARSPVAVNMPSGRTFTKIAVDDEGIGDHVCAIADNKDAYCWGLNNFGQVGSGVAGGQNNEPTLVTGGHKFIDIAATGSQSCGVTVGREIYCWGANTEAQLGAGLSPVSDSDPHPTPLKVVDPS